jgi:hypothetical protein
MVETARFGYGAIFIQQERQRNWMFLEKLVGSEDAFALFCRNIG